MDSDSPHSKKDKKGTISLEPIINQVPSGKVVDGAPP